MQEVTEQLTTIAGFITGQRGQNETSQNLLAFSKKHLKYLHSESFNINILINNITKDEFLCGSNPVAIHQLANLRKVIARLALEQLSVSKMINTEQAKVIERALVIANKKFDDNTAFNILAETYLALVRVEIVPTEQLELIAQLKHCLKAIDINDENEQTLCLLDLCKDETLRVDIKEQLIAVISDLIKNTNYPEKLVTFREALVQLPNKDLYTAND